MVLAIRLFRPLLAGVVCVMFGAFSFAGLAAERPLTLATLPQGAINFVQAQVIAKAIQQNSTLQIRVVPYRGNAAEMAAVNAREAEFSLMDSSDATEAINGSGEFKGRALRGLRVAYTVFPLMVGIMVRADSDIKSLSDLKGRKFPTGWSNFKNGEVLANANLATVGLSLDDVDPVPATGLIQAADDFIAGRTEATIFAIGAPKVAEANAALGGVRFLPIDTSPKGVAAMKSIRSEYFPITAPPLPHFAGVKKPTPVVGFNMVILAGASVSEDAVYKLVKAAHGSKKAFVAGHPSFNAFNPKRMAVKYGSLKYHPGAIRFYKEKGIWPGN